MLRKSISWPSESSKKLIGEKKCKHVAENRPDSIKPAKCTASSVFARGSVHFNSHITPWRQLDEKRHFARWLVQFPNTQLGLGDKVDSSRGQLSLMHARVSSTVSPKKLGAVARSMGRTSCTSPVTMQAFLSVPAKEDGFTWDVKALGYHSGPKKCFSSLRPPFNNTQ